MKYQTKRAINNALNKAQKSVMQREKEWAEIQESGGVRGMTPEAARQRMLECRAIVDAIEKLKLPLKADDSE